MRAKYYRSGKMILIIRTPLQKGTGAHGITVMRLTLYGRGRKAACGTAPG